MSSEILFHTFFFVTKETFEIKLKLILNHIVTSENPSIFSFDTGVILDMKS